MTKIHGLASFAQFIDNKFGDVPYRERPQIMVLPSHVFYLVRERMAYSEWLAQGRAFLYDNIIMLPNVAIHDVSAELE